MNLLDRLIKLAEELIKSVIKTKDKMREPQTYDEVVNNLINRNR